MSVNTTGCPCSRSWANEVTKNGRSKTSISITTSSRDVLYQVKHKICMWKKHFIYGLYNQNRSLKNNLKALKSYSSQKKRGSICCLSSPENNNFLLSGKELLGGKVIYTVAPAMGHNKDSHPECNSRVPAIINALAKTGLTSEFRSSEIIELQTFRPARVDDIASVHERVYVSGLEKAMDQASEQGLIFIEGSGPTYATSTTFQESLLAAGAGISLVDTVVMSLSKTLQHQKSGKILPLVLLWYDHQAIMLFQLDQWDFACLEMWLLLLAMLNVNMD